MGIRNFLIEGVSGAGKTTVAEELERRGYHVVHGDRKFAYYGDAETGEPLSPPEGEDRVEWGYPRWIWPVDRVKALIADRTHPVTFFCGGARNAHHFIDLFDQVFALALDWETLQGRIEGRGDDEFGGKPEEAALVRRVHASGEDIPVGATRIDSTRPVSRVVDDILTRCGETRPPTRR